MARSPLPRVIEQLRRNMAHHGTTGVPDAELLERFICQRDEAAFELLVWRHGKMVLRTCRRLLPTSQDAEDAFQGCFLALAQRAHAIARQECVGGWLYKVAYRLALDEKARAARRRFREQSCSDLALVPGSLDPASEAAQREVRAILDDEVNRLPDRFRAPFVLYHLEGRSYQEIARELGCCLGTVESRLSRARQRLRAKLARRGVGPSAGLPALLATEKLAPACVPHALVVSTAKAALPWVAHQAAPAGLISANVAALTQGVLRSMFLTKLKVGGAMLLATIALGTGVGVTALQTGAAQQPTATGGSAGKVPTDDFAARIDRLIDLLAGDRFADRDQAARELDEIGALALEALRRAAGSGPAEQRRRAQALIEKIEGRLHNARVLEPKRVHLVYQDTPLALALADFKKQSGYDLALADPDGKLKDRKITLDTGAVTFWKALELFCRQAELVDSAAKLVSRSAGTSMGGISVAGGALQDLTQSRSAPSAPVGQILLTPGKPPTVPADSASAVRVRAFPKVDPKAAKGETQLTLELVPEPPARWQRTVSVRVAKAIDDQGHHLEQITPAPEAPPKQGQPAIVPFPNQKGFAGSFKGRPSDPIPTIRLKKGDKTAKTLREISGTVTAQILGKEQPLITVTNVLQSASKTIQCAGGGSIKVIDVTKGENGEITIHCEVDMPPGIPSINDLVNAAVAGQLQGQLPGPSPVSQALSLLDDKREVIPRTRIQTQIARGPNGIVLHNILTFTPAKGQGEPATLVYAVRKSVTVEVPFALKDVPLAE